MERTYWHRQTIEQPLFPDLLWSRPENRAQAGKLLIVGGNVHGFTAPATSFTQAEKCGVGVARVLLPDSLQQIVGRVFEAGEYAPSTPSGSLAQTALGELLALSDWSDGVLLPGDLGRNSETAILLEKFMEKYEGQLTLTRDAADYCLGTAHGCLKRPETLLVISFAQLQKLGIQAKFTTAFTFDMDLLRLVDALHEFTSSFAPHIIVKHLDTLLVAVDGLVSTAKLPEDLPVWRLNTATAAAVWWLQIPNKPFDALSTAIVAK